MKILFVSRWFPYPIDNGSKIRIYNLIRTLAHNHQIDLISFSAEPVSNEQITAMKRYCQQITATEYRADEGNRLSSVLGYLSPKPRSAVISHNSKMQTLIRQAELTEKYDVVLSSQIDMAAYTHTWKASPLIFEEVELTTLYEKYLFEKNPLMRWRRQLMWLKSKQYVKNLLDVYRCCTVVSDLERKRLRDVAPEYQSVEVVPNGVDTVYLSGSYGDIEPDSLIYSGALSYYANMSAVEYFLKEIFPLIKNCRPNVKLYITGSTQGIDLKWLPKVEGVIFTGYLTDIRPRIAQSAVSIVPLQIGGGTRLKILESLALKTPVVSTRKGVEGLDLIPGEDLLVADKPVEFAEAVLRVLEDRSFRDQLGRQGCETVRRSHGWEIMGEKLSKVIETVV
jgi:polysaccharide biosynthesis protein PslH